MKKLPQIAHSLAVLALSPAVGFAGGTINVEIDYMVGQDHTHEPQAAEIAAVVQMFACHGITLNVVVDDPLPHVDVLRCSDTGDPFFTCTDTDSFRTIKNTRFDHSGGGWHYCIFGHRYDAGSGTGSSGLAELGGDDLCVTLGSFGNQVGTPFERAATFAHELGHNLGLDHYGLASTGCPGNYQPNYASVMSYQYQFTGVRTRLTCIGLVDGTAPLKDLDYSDGHLPAIYETGMDEALGLAVVPVDFDCDGTIDASPVSRDYDHAENWCLSTGATNVLRDHDDWTNLTDDTFAFSPGVDTPYRTCITVEEVGALQAEHPGQCTAGQPALASETCISGRMFWVHPTAGGCCGTGESPFNSVAVAVAAPWVEPGSTLYLHPGVHSNGGSQILVTKPLLLASVGGAVIAP